MAIFRPTSAAVKQATDLDGGRRPVRIEADGRPVFDGETDANGVVTAVVAPARRFTILRREEDRWVASLPVPGPS